MKITYILNSVFQKKRKDKKHSGVHKPIEGPWVIKKLSAVTNQFLMLRGPGRFFMSFGSVQLSENGMP